MDAFSCDNQLQGGGAADDHSCFGLKQCFWLELGSPWLPGEEAGSVAAYNLLCCSLTSGTAQTTSALQPDQDPGLRGMGEMSAGLALL